ncbi:unnamed protein product [Bursaphelenchus xylophilus]|uniref:(pine wood nematode) hypothetical protein n=1 Tax=Bursaphelenchus xylophilus TaxID=6326 RepID=A0A1I7RQ89_BURXY|nr:unnamed protein product [Bursaphelenchus xylophilus]CAG9097326.1 unnamed protein product [Bursaphelenchus xylophilus]
MSDEFAEEASIMMENAELNFAAEHNGHFERGPVTPPEVTEPSTSVLNGPPTDEGTETFIGTESAAIATEKSDKSLAESDGEISSTSEKDSPKPSPRRVKKRRYSTGADNDKKSESHAKCHYNENHVRRTTFKPRNGPTTPELDSKLTHPLIKAIRHVKTMPITVAFDLLLSIPPTDISQLGMEDVLEVLDVMKEFNDRREELTGNRIELTKEVRQICDQEIQLLTDLEHVMTPDERIKLEQLRNCPPSMDEVVPVKAEIDPYDVNVQTSAIKLPAVDLLPPPETPLIGQIDSSWDPLVKHIPMELRGFLPPQPEHQSNGSQENGSTVIPPIDPLTNNIPSNEFHSDVPPASSSQPKIITFDKPPPNVELPPPNMSQPPPSLASIKPKPLDTSVPPPSLHQPPPDASSVPISSSGASGRISPVSAFRQSIKPSLLSSLVNTSVPPPNLPPPNLNVPPPNLSLPPPSLNLPPPNVKVPPPNLAVPPPNLKVPPPVMESLLGPKPQSTPNVPGSIASASSPFSIPPPQIKHTVMPNKPVPLMSIEHPPGFVPRINQTRRQPKQKTKPSNSSTPTQNLSTASPAAAKTPEKSFSETEFRPTLDASGDNAKSEDVGDNTASNDFEIKEEVKPEIV